MEIKSVIPRPYENSISPVIIFKVDITYTELQEGIINVEGWLESDDGKMLSKVEAMPEILRIGKLGARNSSHDSKFGEIAYNTELVARLDEKTLSYIEERRMTNAKRDVFLTLNLNARSIVTNAVVSHFHEIDSKSIGLPPTVRVFPDSGSRIEGKILAYGSDSQFSTRFRNRWIISGDGSPVFLSIKSQNIRKEGIRINSIDWTQDYLPKLGLGEYFIIELPKGRKVIQGAWKYVEKAEKCYRQWNTKGVYAHCREVGALLNKTINGKFRDDPIIKKWKRAIQKFEYLTSLDLHEENIEAEEPKGKVSIGRPEVEHILIVTKALIKYAEELLPKKS